MTVTIELTDAHNHAQELYPRDAPAPGLPRCVANGTSPADWDAVARLAAANPGIVIPSYGLHPWFAGDAPRDWEGDLRCRLGSDPGAAIGEVGLDKTPRSPTLDTQEEVFRQQLAIAREFDRPVSVHCVRARGRMLDVLRDEGLPRRGVLWHDFAAPAEMLPGLVGLEGLFFSLRLGGSKPPPAELVRALPADRVLIESDATADGGRSPADVLAGHGALAEICGETLEAVATRVSATFRRLFLPPAGSPGA